MSRQITVRINNKIQKENEEWISIYEKIGKLLADMQIEFSFEHQDSMFSDRVWISDDDREYLSSSEADRIINVTLSVIENFISKHADKMEKTKMENMEKLKITRLYIEPSLDEIIEDVRLSITDEYRIKERWNREFLSRLQNEFLDVQNLDIAWDRPTLAIDVDVDVDGYPHQLYRKVLDSIRDIEKSTNQSLVEEALENHLERLFFVLDREQKIVHGWGETLEKAVEIASRESISGTEIYKCLYSKLNWNFYSSDYEISINDNNIIGFYSK